MAIPFFRLAPAREGSRLRGPHEAETEQKRQTGCLNPTLGAVIGPYDMPTQLPKTYNLNLACGLANAPTVVLFGRRKDISAFGTVIKGAPSDSK